jgi:hypothetical protein
MEVVCSCDRRYTLYLLEESVCYVREREMSIVSFELGLGSIVSLWYLSGSIPPSIRPSVPCLAPTRKTNPIQSSPHEDDTLPWLGAYNHMFPGLHSQHWFVVNGLSSRLIWFSIVSSVHYSSITELRAVGMAWEPRGGFAIKNHVQNAAGKRWFASTVRRAETDFTFHA